MIQVGDLVTLNKRGLIAYYALFDDPNPLGLVVRRPGFNDPSVPDTHRFNKHNHFRIKWLKGKESIPQDIGRKWIKLVKKGSSK